MQRIQYVFEGIKQKLFWELFTMNNHVLTHMTSSVPCETKYMMCIFRQCICRLARPSLKDLLSKRKAAYYQDTLWSMKL